VGGIVWAGVCGVYGGDTRIMRYNLGRGYLKKGKIQENIERREKNIGYWVKREKFFSFLD
jgi:hypothetical protein